MLHNSVDSLLFRGFVMLDPANLSTQLNLVDIPHPFACTLMVLADGHRPIGFDNLPRMTPNLLSLAVDLSLAAAF